MAEATPPTGSETPEEHFPSLRNWGPLRDIPFRLTVEIGRSRMSVGDLLGLEVGSLVVTTKLSGEPMDISLNDEIFGRTEIIIIKDKLWARLTKIVGGGD